MTLLRDVLAVAAMVALVACDDKPSSTSGAAPSTKVIPSASVRTTRLDCGGKFGACPAGETCFIDKPGCDGTGFCGPAEASCAHPLAFCGCNGIELACTFPKRPWKEKGTQCFTEGAFGATPPPSASAPPLDAGRDAR